MIELENVFIKSDGAKSNVIEEKAIIINISGRHCYQLNAAATFVWGLLNGKNTAEAIIKKTAIEYNKKKVIVEKDVFDLLDNLLREQLIKLKP